METSDCIIGWRKISSALICQDVLLPLSRSSKTREGTVNVKMKSYLRGTRNFTANNASANELKPYSNSPKVFALEILRVCLFSRCVEI